MLKFLFFLLYLFLTLPPFSTALFFYIQVKILRYPHGTLHNSFSSRALPIVLSATCRWNMRTHQTKHWLGLFQILHFSWFSCRNGYIFPSLWLSSSLQGHMYMNIRRIGFIWRKKRKFGEISEKEGVKKHCYFKTRVKCGPKPMYHVKNAITKDVLR